jgi:glucan phosphoethanolaminetransferase (alkaline phosphatase superfamily)
MNRATKIQEIKKRSLLHRFVNFSNYTDQQVDNLYDLLATPKQFDSVPALVKHYCSDHGCDPSEAESKIIKNVCTLAKKNKLPEGAMILLKGDSVYGYTNQN